MKKITAILLLFIFLITNSGMAIAVHFCGKKLASIDFFSSDKHNCPCSKKAMKPGCCKDKTITLKAINDLTKVNQLALKVNTPKLVLATINQIEILTAPHFQYSSSEFYHPPPNKSKLPIHLLNRVFLI